MAWPLIVAAIAAAALQKANTTRTARRQDEAAAASIRNQAEFQRQANARNSEQLDKLEASGPEDEFATRSSQIRDQLRRKQSMALAGIQNTGGGDAVTALGDEASGTAIDYGDFINESFSGIDAPVLQRQGEAFDRADTESFLNTLRRNSAQEDYLLRLKQAGIRDNPLMSMASTALSAYAGSGGFGQFGGGAQGGQSLANLGGQTPQQFYAPPALGPSAPATMFTPFNTRRGTGIGMNLGGG